MAVESSLHEGRNFKAVQKVIVRTAMTCMGLILRHHRGAHCITATPCASVHLCCPANLQSLFPCFGRARNGTKSVLVVARLEEAAMETIAENIMASLRNKDQLVSSGIALFVGLLLLLRFVYGFSEKKKKKLPPGPFPWPVFGNLFLGGTHPHQVFSQLAKRYGNIMSLFFGSVRVVIVSDSNMAKELFSVSDVNFASRPIHDFMYTTAKYMNYGDKNVSMAISEYTQKVREMRQLCISELFTAQKLDMKRSTRMEEIHRTVAAMGESPTPVDLRPILSELSLRINCRSTFNRAFLHSERLPSSEGTLDPQAFRRLETENTKLLATHNLLDIIPGLRVLFGRFDLGGIHARWQDVTKRKVSCADSILQWYRQDLPHGREESETDFAQTLLLLTDGGKYTMTAARALIFELLTAGTDTIAATLEWALLELVRHPQCMKKLQAEIGAKFGTIAPVDEDEAAQLPYLQAVMKEVLRLHVPTTFGLPHSNKDDATLGGYHIPARTAVMANFWTLHRDPSVWGDDALTFNPDRFLGSDLGVNTANNFQYIPFGAGRRICPGRAMAVRVLATTVGSFVHALELSAPPGVELTADEGTDGLNIRPETPLRLQISLRPAASLYFAPTNSTSNA